MRCGQVLAIVGAMKLQACAIFYFKHCRTLIARQNFPREYGSAPGAGLSSVMVTSKESRSAKLEEAGERK
jgi:hypothetical protein